MTFVKLSELSKDKTPSIKYNPHKNC